MKDSLHAHSEMDKCLTNLELQANNTRQQIEAIDQSLSKLGDGHILDTICSHTNPCFCVAVKVAHVFNDITDSFITTYKMLRIILKKTRALRHFVPGDNDCSLIMTEREFLMPVTPLLRSPTKHILI